MKRWQWWLLGALIAALSVLLLAIMRPPGGQSSPPGQDKPWQISRSQDGATITVFGLTLGVSTVREAVAKFGRRYELGLFQDPADRRLSLEAYFRDAVVGGLNARLVMTAHLPDPVLAVLQTHAGNGKTTTDGGRRYPVVEADEAAALGAVVTALTFMPVVKFDADLVRRRFGEPAEQVSVKDGTHWLYPALGLDLLLGANGEALLQYTPPPDFAQRLKMPLGRN